MALVMDMLAPLRRSRPTRQIKEGQAKRLAEAFSGENRALRGAVMSGIGAAQLAAEDRPITLPTLSCYGNKPVAYIPRSNCLFVDGEPLKPIRK